MAEGTQALDFFELSVELLLLSSVLAVVVVFRDGGTETHLAVDVVEENGVTKLRPDVELLPLELALVFRQYLAFVAFDRLS